MHCSAFLVGGLKRAPQIFFLNFFVWVVLFGHNYGPVNQKKTHQNFSCKVGKSTSICAIDLALQHICLLENVNEYSVCSFDDSFIAKESASKWKDLTRAAITVLIVVNA